MFNIFLALYFISHFAKSEKKAESNCGSGSTYSRNKSYLLLYSYKRTYITGSAILCWPIAYPPTVSIASICALAGESPNTQVTRSSLYLEYKCMDICSWSSIYYSRCAYTKTKNKCNTFNDSRPVPPRVPAMLDSDHSCRSLHFQIMHVSQISHTRRTQPILSCLCSSLICRQRGSVFHKAITAL